MTTEHCIDCKYFVDFDRIGTCRRFPVYQHRGRTDWCGEFNSRTIVALPVLETSEKLDILKPKRGRPPKDKE
jgi:hypothetical protein